jgi:hypothetical protein
MHTEGDEYPEKKTANGKRYKRAYGYQLDLS